MDPSSGLRFRRLCRLTERLPLRLPAEIAGPAERLRRRSELFASSETVSEELAAADALRELLARRESLRADLRRGTAIPDLLAQDLRSTAAEIRSARLRLARARARWEREHAPALSRQELRSLSADLLALSLALTDDDPSTALGLACLAREGGR